MSRTLLIIFLFLSTTSFCQRTVVAKSEIPGRFKYQSCTEKFHVLKDDRSVRHGLYELFDSRSRLLTKGYYKQDKKDSLWTEFDIWGHFAAASGYYREGRKVGIWEVYKKADTLELKYDYDHDKALFIKADTSKKFAVLMGADTIEKTLDQPPVYLGGSSFINRIIANNIYYPDEARENSIEGRVLVAFTVFADGHASQPWILRSVHKSVDEEAISVASRIPPDWKPGILEGRPVTSVFVLPVIFKLE